MEVEVSQSNLTVLSDTSCVYENVGQQAMETWATLKNLLRCESQQAVVGKQVKILSTGPEFAL